MRTVYVSNFTGKIYAGDHKGVTPTVVYPDLKHYEKGTDDGIYTAYTLKEQHKAENTTPVKVLHR